MSAPLQKESDTIRVVRFVSDCKSFSGSLFVQYKNEQFSEKDLIGDSGTIELLN